jgi:hypothetical protein
VAVDPIIIDDGGSVRIRHVRSTAASGAMETLLDVPSQYTFPAALSTFTSLKLNFFDPATGVATAAFNGPVQSGDSVEINAADFKVRIVIGAATKLTVSGATAPPLVETKASAGRCRYFVRNAPPIDKVTTTISGVVNTPFDQTALAVTARSVYTVVQLS